MRNFTTIYMNANAPTVAEGAIRALFWEGVSPYSVIQHSIEHAATYGIPQDQYKKLILAYLTPALETLDGFKRLLKTNMWHSPGPQNIKAYLHRDWETDIPVPILFHLIRGAV